MISVIVPFKKGEVYLKDCLNSLRNQEVKDIEVLLIIDNGAEAIDREKYLSEYADIGLVIEDNKQTAGVAGARNTGIKLAGKPYIYFLDSDDYVLEDSLKKLIEKIQDNDFCFGQIRHTWFMREAFNRDQMDVVADSKPGEKVSLQSEKYNVDNINFFDYRIARHKQLNDISCLGILYKKEFLIEQEIFFNEELKYYSDLGFVEKVLAKAKNISADVDSLYVQRYHSDDVNLPSLSQMQDEKKYEEMKIAYIEGLKISKGDAKTHLEKNICDYFIDIYGRLFHENGGSGINETNFSEMCEMVRACSNNTINSYHFFKKKILKKAIAGDRAGVAKNVNLRLAIKKLRKMVYPKHLFRTINLYVFSRLGVKDNWICFESFSGRQFSGQPKYIYEYLRKNYSDKYKFIWIRSDRTVKIDGKCKKVKRFGLRYYYYTSRAKYWVLNSRQPVLFKKKKGQVILETWHGTPLKKLFFDLEDVHGTNPNFKKVAYRQSRNWDYLLSDNPFSTEKLSSCFFI